MFLKIAWYFLLFLSFSLICLVVVASIRSSVVPDVAVTIAIFKFFLKYPLATLFLIGFSLALAIAVTAMERMRVATFLLNELPRKTLFALLLLGVAAGVAFLAVRNFGMWAAVVGWILLASQAAYFFFLFFRKRNPTLR